MASTALGGLCCVSGTALGAAVASLLSRHTDKSYKDSDKEDDTLDSEVLGWRGFSMTEARAYNLKLAGKALEKAPREVLNELQRGNTRFYMGTAKRPPTSAFHRRALISTQFPKVAVLSCADSRVPVEIVFDQGLGDIFVVRVAGNCLTTATAASLQFAVCHLKVKVLVVIGHEGCGAIKAAQLPVEAINREPDELAQALLLLKSGLDGERLANVTDARALDRESVVTNVQKQVEGIALDPSIMEKVRSQQLIVLGAFYEISSGIVDFFFELTELTARQMAKVAEEEGIEHTSSMVLKRQVTPGVQNNLLVSATQ